MGGHQHWPPHHDTNCYDPCPLPTGPAPTTFRSGGVLTTCAHFSSTTTTPLVWHPTRDRARAVRRSGARHKADPCSTPQNLSGGLLRASRGLDTVGLSIFAGRTQRTASVQLSMDPITSPASAHVVAYGRYGLLGGWSVGLGLVTGMRLGAFELASVAHEDMRVPAGICVGYRTRFVGCTRDVRGMRVRCA